MRSSSCSFDVFILLVCGLNYTVGQTAVLHSPFPLVVLDVHDVVELIARHAAVVSAPHMQLEHGLRLEVGNPRLPWRGRESEHEFEVD